MKLLAISQRIDQIKGRNEVRDSIDQRLLEFIQCIGYCAVPVPNIFFSRKEKKSLRDKSNFYEWLARISPDGIILSGGNDLGDYYSRDETEYSLIEYAEKNKLPLLGICRGMQIIGVKAGSNLISVKGHINLRHKLIGRIDIEVNSFHNKALSKCPDNYKILAKSKDGVIKAIKHINLPWEGWMWHPEREFPFQKSDLHRFQRLFK